MFLDCSYLCVLQLTQFYGHLCYDWVCYKYKLESTEDCATAIYKQTDFKQILRFSVHKMVQGDDKSGCPILIFKKFWIWNSVNKLDLLAPQDLYLVYVVVNEISSGAWNGKNNQHLYLE